MKIKSILCAALAVVILCMSFSGCTTEKENNLDYKNVKVDPSKITVLKGEIDEILNNNDFYGSTAVSLNSQNLYNNSFGYLDPLKEHKLNSKSRYMINVLSESITVAAILKLEADKKIDFQDPLSKYFNNKVKGNYLKKITVGDLVNNKVCFGSYIMDFTGHTEEWNQLAKYFAVKNPDKNDRKISELMVHHILAHGAKTGAKTGDETASNYYLMGKIISKVSGESYSEYVKKNIFEKLGMKNSGFINSKFDIKGIDLNNKKWVYSGFSLRAKSFGFLYSVYGIVSCAEDMDVFYRALLNGKLGFDFAKKVRTSIGNEFGGFKKNGNTIYSTARFSMYCTFVKINIQNNEIVTMLSNSVGKTDIVKAGSELYESISAKVNEKILSNVKEQ